MRRLLVALSVLGTLTGALLLTLTLTSSTSARSTTPRLAGGVAWAAMLEPVDSTPDPVRDSRPVATPVAASVPVATSVTVRPGDVLSSLASRVGRSWEQLAGWNHLQDPNLIVPGEVLKVPDPGYRPPAPPLPVRSAPESPQTPSRGSQTVAAASTVSSGGWTAPWACIAFWESGSNPADNTGNGYYGGLQFALSTWQKEAPKVGVYVSNPIYASIPQQEAVANRTLADSSWEAQWPQTSKKCGYW